jgi:hypothetical protein
MYCVFAIKRGVSDRCCLKYCYLLKDACSERLKARAVQTCNSHTFVFESYTKLAQNCSQRCSRPSHYCLMICDCVLSLLLLLFQLLLLLLQLYDTVTAAAAAAFTKFIHA